MVVLHGQELSTAISPTTLYRALATLSLQELFIVSWLKPVDLAHAALVSTELLFTLADDFAPEAHTLLFGDACLGQRTLTA